MSTPNTPERAASVTRLAVLGSPIAHSRSPVLHAAAYRALGLDWHYDRAEVDEAGLPGFLRARGPGWRGLSLTMPLKSAVIPLCATVSATALRAGAVNTIVFRDRDPQAAFDGHNTDVLGIVHALQQAGAGHTVVDLLGAGNTAASAIVAFAELGTERLRILARTPQRAAAAVALAQRLGIEVELLALSQARPAADTELVVNTIPDGSRIPFEYPAGLRADATLFEIVYDPWPTALAASWLQAGGRVVSGLEMLLHQAVGQVRLFLRPEDRPRELSDAELTARMRASLAGARVG